MTRLDRRPGRGWVLEVVDVTVSFGAVRALDRISIEVFEGQFVGIIGPNGAGKTTLFNVISGFTRPDSGRIRLAGRRATAWTPTQRARAGIGRTFQNVGLQKKATVAENLRTAEEVTATRLEVLEYLRPGTLRARPDRPHDREDLVELLALGEILEAPVGVLPTGTAKRVELACALLRRPRLLLLDEPSSGVDPEETERLGAVLRDLHRARELTIVMIEHDMSLAMSLCEYLYVLDFGALLAQGNPAAVRTDPLVIEAYLGKEVA